MDAKFPSIWRSVMGPVFPAMHQRTDGCPTKHENLYARSMDKQPCRADDSCKGEVEFFHLNPEGASVHKSITVNFALLSIIASSWVPAVRAQTDTQPAAAAAPVASTWKIASPGVRNVPMTAHPEQSLPLQGTATLTCADELTVPTTTHTPTLNTKP